MQHTAVHCNTLQYTTIHSKTTAAPYIDAVCIPLIDTTHKHTATHCSTLQYIAIHYNTQQNNCSALYWRSVHSTNQHQTATCCNTLQYAAWHFNTLQNTAAHCNTAFHHATTPSNLTFRQLQPKHSNLEMHSKIRSSCMSFRVRSGGLFAVGGREGGEQEGLSVLTARHRGVGGWRRRKTHNILYVLVRMYIYLYTHIYIYIYIYTCICTQIHTCTRACTYPYIYIYARLYMFMCIHIASIWGS